MRKPRRPLPLRPLLTAFRATANPPPADPRDAAIRATRPGWLNGPALDSRPAAELADLLGRFHDAVAPHSWHPDAVRRNVGLVRHGLTHLLRATDPLAVRFGRCLPPDGHYAVPGVGPAFWAAVVKALDPDCLPDWSAEVLAGLVRTGLADPDAGLGPACDAYAFLLDGYPGLSAADLDRFFRRVGVMVGRELPDRDPVANGAVAALPDVVRRVRTKFPLRKRLAEQGKLIAETRTAVAAAEDWDAAFAALCRFTGPAGCHDEHIPFGLREWVAAAFADPVPETIPADVAPGPASAVLHLRDPARFPLWTDAVAAGLARLDDAHHPGLPMPERYMLLREVAIGLRQRFRIHPLEVADVLTSAGRLPTPEPDEPVGGPRFGGFCTDTFRFLKELAEHNNSAWMTEQRDRYHFAVREPLVELCEAVAGRYVRPVLEGEYGWELETDARPGRALTSICKNDYGRSAPYQPGLWVTFYRRSAGAKRNDVQLFVKLDSAGVRVGFHLGKTARDAGRRFRTAVQTHAELLARAVRMTGAADELTFRLADDGPAVPVRGAADLRAWASGRDLFADRLIPADAAVLRSDDLANEVLLTFDRLVPLFAAAVEADPSPILSRRAGDPSAPPFDRAAFRKETGLGELWLSRTLDLLRLKKQLILQGVPGTGKTHVARCLARLLTANRPDAVRLVQFHPGYSYEEFVEGIRPQSTDGGVAYPVTAGVLTAFAAAATARPADPYVLLIDEVNRGNLPRVFGELLFLLEYRDQAVTLPYSKREFRLPPNLYLLGTMNPSDRSTGALDQALRRRFSFVDMPPDPAVLATWLEAHPPADGDAFGGRVVRLFEELNRRLTRDLGPEKQVGHSAFMVPGLTEEQLRAVWDHHVRPVLAEHFAGHPGRLAGYELEKLMGDRPSAKKVLRGQ
jgi:5-methylcytosine-specific restriction protein B